MSNSYLSKNTSITSLIHPGNTTFDNSYSGFPPSTFTNNHWENPSALGYQINNIDIANSVQAAYTDYTSNSSIIIPTWCNKLKIIAISGGGGGGGGGANAKANENNGGGTRGGAGGSGAGGMLSIIKSKQLSLSNYNNMNITFGANDSHSSTGAGGAKQLEEGANGNPGQYGVGIILFASANDFIRISGGDHGDAGEGSDNANNNAQGGSNGGALISYTPYFENYYFYVDTTGGTGGGQGGNASIGDAGIVLNYSLDNDPPQININQPKPPQGNGGIGIDNDNEKPGIGQGGVGGWNSNNDKGYVGQNGGAALVRVYFLHQ
jgi:hypothetical protein